LHVPFDDDLSQRSFGSQATKLSAETDQSHSLSTFACQQMAAKSCRQNQHQKPNQKRTIPS
jgi:hypothetical protein